MTEYFPARAKISRGAFSHNLDVLRNATKADVMAIVKADAYGHGLKRIAQWAIEEGVTWLGVAQLGEALRLREALPDPHILTWIYAPGAPFAQAIQQRLDLGVGSDWALHDVVVAAQEIGQKARVHIKFDTSMSRGGFPVRQVPQIARRVKYLADNGVIEPVGLWSHLSRADEPDSGETERQVALFNDIRREFEAQGVTFQVHHLAASGGLLWHPEAHFDLVRPGIALYGLSPEPAIATATDLGLRAVMQLEGDLIIERDVSAGTGVSYGHTYVTEEDEHLAVVPLGYADGIPRSSAGTVVVHPQSNATQNSAAEGILAPIRGRICMDQFVISAPGVAHGDTAVLFGDASAGYPTADEWAEQCGTIGYEIVTRIGVRVPRLSID